MHYEEPVLWIRTAISLPPFPSTAAYETHKFSWKTILFIVLKETDGHSENCKSCPGSFKVQLSATIEET